MTDLRTPPLNDGDIFRERVRQYASERALPRLSILLAGCGWGHEPRFSALGLGGVEVHVTGVDADTPALRAHTEARRDLGTWHLGDLRTVPMPPRAYDVVCAPYLIERLPHAELVLDRMCAALKPGGLLLIRLRDGDTAYGRVDRLLPRALLGGRDDGPPPPVYGKVASDKGMRWYCGMRGLVIAEQFTTRATGGPGGLRTGLARLLAVVTSATADHSEVSLVIRKPENRFARVI